MTAICLLYLNICARVLTILTCMAISMCALAPLQVIHMNATIGSHFETFRMLHAVLIDSKVANHQWALGHLRLKMQHCAVGE